MRRLPSDALITTVRSKSMSNYDTDMLGWSERQASLLRRLASGEQVNETIDWENVVEEVESLGGSERHRTESLLIQAARAFQEPMRQRIDMDWIYRRARHRLPASIDGQLPFPLPDASPLTLDELLDGTSPAP